jgi:hypothetical protein
MLGSGIMDDIPFHTYGMKDPEGVMTVMTTYGIPGKRREGN